MRRFFITAIALFVLCMDQARAGNHEGLPEETTKRFDLVLVHGLSNKHRWSEDFLRECLEIWGSGRVFIVYTGTSSEVLEKEIDSRKIVYAGGDGSDAGRVSIEKQATIMASRIDELEKRYGLRTPFSIIAHSMGGLVARRYIAEHPGEVADLVTLGTPHHGSPLAESFQWMGFFLSATEAIEDLKPENMERFNTAYPVAKAPLAEGGRIYTIRGVPEGSDCFGWSGELLFGWQVLAKAYDTGNDGLVPEDSALIEGAIHIGDFPGFDHYHLVQRAEVVKKAAEYLR
ncbi:MAG: hypothetical protein Kow0089_03470 [Desulfobulbaceae bacterium]